MKMRKRVIATVLSVMAAVLITAPCCEAASSKTTSQKAAAEAQEALKDSIRKLDGAESLHTQLSLDVGMKVFGIPAEAGADMELVSFEDPGKWKSDIRLDMGILGESSLEAYAGETKNGYMLCLKGKGGWETYKVSKSALCSYDGKQLMMLYLNQLQDVHSEGSVTQNGRKAYKYTGKVTHEGLKAILLDSGSLGILSDLFKDSMLKTLGQYLEQEDEVEKLMTLAEDVEMTVYIDARTGYPMQCTMDITETLEDAYELLDGKLKPAKAEKKLWSGIRMTKTQLSVTCDQWNEAADFHIPKAAIGTY